jgi:integrase
VKLVISNNQTDAYISLSVYVPESAWERDGLQRPVKKNYSVSKMINDRIEQGYLEAKKKMFELENSGEIRRMKASEIKQYIEKKGDTTYRSTDFFAFAKVFLESCNRERTRATYEWTLNAFSTYLKDKTVSFSEISVTCLRGFEKWLIDEGLSLNSRAIHFRNIRAIFNRAIDDKLIGLDVYPFRSFKIKTMTGNKECLTAEQVYSLYMYSFRTKALEMARDYWMLMFFFCGISPVDLFHLKKPDKNNRVSFVREKESNQSHEVIRHLIQPEAAAIIERYKADGDSEFLLCFESKYVNYDSFKRFVSKKIREIAVITGFEGLTLYWARYSWATVADGLNIQEKTISKGLGHTDRTVAGRHYIAFDWSKVDRANRTVIDAVLFFSQ